MSQKKETLKYEKDEKVLCFHGALLYQAKILDTRFDSEPLYYVHYQGWNKNWDEWVKEERMVKYDEQGLKMQKEVERLAKSGKKLKVLRKSELQKQPYPPPEIVEHIGLTMEHAVTENTGPEESSALTPEAGCRLVTPPSVKAGDEVPSLTAPSTLTSSHTGSAGSARKRRPRPSNHPSKENDEGTFSRPQFKVVLPDRLKAWLADDWDLTTKQSRLLNLPAQKTVLALFKDYLNQSSSKAAAANGQSAFVVTQEYRQEFVEGLRVNFNFLLGLQLLYKFERPQYAELVRTHEGIEMADLYGPMHLLRLLVKLKDVMAFLGSDRLYVDLMEAVAADFITFLDNNRDVYFKLEDYVSATPDYMRAAMC